MTLENELQEGGVVFSAEGIEERRGDRRVVFVPRDAIRTIELARGPAGERLIAQLVFATALLVGALSCLAITLGEWRAGGTIHVNVIAGLAFAPFAGWIFRSALRSVHYLRVRTENDARKIAFAPGTDRRLIHALLERAHRVHLYEVMGNDAATDPYR